MTITTRPCVVCHKTTTLEVDADAYKLYQDGMFIQNAFPDMSPGQRELLISGTHSECLEELTMEYLKFVKCLGYFLSYHQRQ